MRLSLATNFDNELPSLVKDHQVGELFGKLPSDAVGGGRSSYALADTSCRHLIKHVRLAHDNGLEFNYLINAACLDNREFTRKGQKAIRKLLDWLYDIKVDWLTVSTPYLLEMVKALYPQFKVKVGVFAEVNSPSSAVHWESLGADRITLPPITLNRDFERLKIIRDSVKCDLELLVNHTCLLDCPFREYHKLLLSHSSQKGHSGRFLIDYCLIKCTAARLSDPTQYIKSPWIRPEDLHIYESLGFTSFKVLERGAPTQTLAMRAKTYSQGHYDGNLLDLMQPFGFKAAASATQPKKRRFWEYIDFMKPWKASTVGLLKYREFAASQGMLSLGNDESPVYIDNRLLDGFLESFPSSACTSKACSNCNYCNSFADSAVKVDQEFCNTSLRLAEENLLNMTIGRMWHWI